MRFEETLPAAVRRHHPGVEMLLRPGVLAGRLREDGILPGARATTRVVSAEPFYLRIKTEGCVLMQIRVRTEEEGTAAKHIVYARVVGAARARELAAKWAHLHPASEGPLRPFLLLEDAGAVIFSFPNDVRLRGLKTCCKPDKLKRLLDEGTPRPLPEGVHAGGRKAWVHALRWKPERRYVFRYEFPLRRDDTGKRVAWNTWIGRVYADGAGQRTAAALRALDRKRVERPAGIPAGLEPPRLPALEAIFPERRILFQTAMTGRTLRTVAREDPIGEVRDAVCSAARGMAWMHALPQAVAPPRPSQGMAQPGAPDPALEAMARDWEILEPRLAGAARDVARRCRMVPRRDTTWIHGDLYAQQILIDDRGRAALIDFDEAGGGDAHRDVGNLIAYAVTTVREGRLPRSRGEELARGFLDAYVSAGGRIDEERLHAECGRSLALLSHAPLRTLTPRWREEAALRLDHALRIAAGGEPLDAMEGAT